MARENAMEGDQGRGELEVSSAVPHDVPRPCPGIKTGRPIRDASDGLQAGRPVPSSVVVDLQSLVPMSAAAGWFAPSLRRGRVSAGPAMESLLSLLQKNVLNTQRFQTCEEVRLAIATWIETEHTARLARGVAATLRVRVG